MVNTKKHAWLRSMALGMGVVLVGCSSHKPMEHIGAAEGSVGRIQRAEVRNYASSDVYSAAIELNQAQRALNEGSYGGAVFYSEQAQLDATLAEARASRVQAQAQLDAVTKEVQHLRDVSKRPSPAAAPAEVAPEAEQAAFEK